jgi:hypothetical protein
MASSRYRIKDLLDIMALDVISTDEKVDQLRKELYEHFDAKIFLRCRTMGDLVKQTMRYSLKPHLSRIQRNLGKLTDKTI